MTMSNKNIAEALTKLNLHYPAIRQGFGGLTIGALRPVVKLDPRNVRLNWEQRYGIPWGSRGDHSTGIGVITQLATRPDNPLDLSPHPYSLDITDQVDAAILGSASGKPAWEVLRERFTDDSNKGTIDTSDCPSGWNCTPMPEEIKEKCRSGEFHCTTIAQTTPEDKFVWQKLPSLVRGKVWIRYNPLKVDMRTDSEVEPTPANPDSPSSIPDATPQSVSQQIAAALNGIELHIANIRNIIEK